MKFDNVSVIRSANCYFDGRVTSRTLMFADGTKKTLGVMLPGEYEFSTDAAELIEIQTGELDLLLPEASEWKAIKGGDSFNVPAASTFTVRVQQLTDYCCSFLD